MIALPPLFVVNITEGLCHRLAHQHLPRVFLDNKHLTAGFGHPPDDITDELRDLLLEEIYSQCQAIRR